MPPVIARGPVIVSPDFETTVNDELVDLYRLNTVDEVIQFEVLQIIKNNIFYKKCKYCGKYFVPLGRTDSEYCYRIMNGEAKPCNEIGAIKTFDLLHKDDEIFRAYQQAYRRMDSRKRTKSITKDDFKSWGKKARAMRKDCYDGKITFDEFQAWLDEGK